MTVSDKEERNPVTLYPVLLWILATFFSWFFHRQGNWVINVIILPVLTLFSFLWLVRHGRGMRPANVLLCAFAGWYVLTRLFNADPFNVNNGISSMHVLASTFVVFPLATGLQEGGRRRALVLTGALVVTVLGVVAWVGVMACLKRELFYVPFTNGMNIGVSLTEGRLSVLYMHPNLSAVMFIAATGFCLYLLVAVRRKIWRLPVALAGVGLYLALALTVSRSAMVVLSLELGGFVFLLLNARLPIRRNLLRIPMAAAACAVVATVAFLGLYNAIGIVNGASGGTASGLLPVRGARAETAAAASATDGDYIYSYHLGENIDTLADRTVFYAAVIPVIRNRPMTLLIGDSLDRVIPALNVVVQREASHWHNSFLQTLMTAGLPALLCALAFSVLLVAKCFDIVFVDRAPLADQVLLLPALGILLHGMLEAFLFVSFGVQNILFFLLAGFLFAVPGKHRMLSLSQSGASRKRLRL